jgi:hypothetical protein
MAVKVQLMKMMQEFRGLANITARRPAPKPGLFLIQLRSHTQRTTPQKNKRIINVEIQDHLLTQYPVKITHLQPAISARASALAQVSA